MQRRYHKRFKPEKKTGAAALKVNRQIRLPVVMLIDETGQNLGEVQTFEAIRRAEDMGLDLVEVNPKANPPIAKIMDFGQYKYQQEKREKKAKATQKKSETKGVRLSFRIKGQDLEIRKKQVQKFLEEGHKVQVELVLRGRERAHKDQAISNLKSFVDSIGAGAKIVQPLSKQGGRMSIVVGK